MLHNVGMLELDELGHLHQMMAKPGYFSYPSDLGTASSSSLKVDIGEMGLGSVINMVRQKASGSETQTKLHWNLGD